MPQMGLALLTRPLFSFPSNCPRVSEAEGVTKIVAPFTFQFNSLQIRFTSSAQIRYNYEKRKLQSPLSFLLPRI